MSESNRDPQFSDVVVDALKNSGWQPGRRVDDSTIRGWLRSLEGFEVNGAAERVLQEFGGLKIDQRGPGVSVARGPINFDPMKASGEDDRFADFASLTGKLFPLGEVWGGYALFAISPDERVFAVMDDVWLVGESFAEALDHLVRGVKSKRLGP